MSTRLTATLIAAVVAVPLCCVVPLAVIAGVISTCADSTEHPMPDPRSDTTHTSATTVDLDQCAIPCQPAITTPPSGAPSTSSPGHTAPCQWVAPVNAPIVSGFRTHDRPGHDGVDLGAARGTPIRAVSAAIVVVVRCNITPASHGCDRDGSPSTPGCGWYLDLRHDGDIYTRYCHMLTRPAVSEGQTVTAGQVIGLVGSSGHSSGPHLHFEVHLGDRSVATATDPVAFMATRAPLGQQP